MRGKTKILIILSTALTLFFGIISQLYSMQPKSQNEIETYRFDPNHTSVLWSVRHFGFSELTGKCMAEGTLEIDRNHLENSKLNVVIHTNQMVTAIPKLDEVLKGANYFATSKFPNATFISTKVQPSGKTTGLVTGLLKIKNIQKPVTLKVKLNQQGIHPYFHKQSVGFSAQAKIKRSDFDMAGFAPDVSDEVTVDIQAEAQLVTN